MSEKTIPNTITDLDQPEEENLTDDALEAAAGGTWIWWDSSRVTQCYSQCHTSL